MMRPTEFEHIRVGAAAVFIVASSLLPVVAAAADCPVQMRSIVFAAQSSAHDFVSYAIRLNGQPQTGTNVELSLSLTNGTTLHVPWQNVTIEKPEFQGDTPTAFGTIDRRKADITSGSVDAVSQAPGQTPAPCDGQTTALNAVDNEPWGFDVINATKHAFSPVVTAVPMVHHTFVDAAFRSRISPSYPVAERNAGVEGDVTVRITVGVDGNVAKAVVIESSEDDDIDMVALDAARRSTFKPATEDGTPIEHDYLVVYTFSVQGDTLDPNISTAGYSVPKSNCPLSAGRMQLVNAGNQKGPDWYEMTFDATRTDIVSAEVEFYDSALTYVMVPWDSIQLSPLDPDGTTRLAATIPWTGDDPLKFWVASVKYADGHQQECTTYYELVDRPDAAGPLPRSLAPSTETARVETRRLDAPLVGPYPSYPPASLASDVTGDVGIDVVVNDAGAVTGALVVSSSKSADLDNAALAAAMKAKFSPRRDLTYFPMRVYYLEYDFEDSVD